MGLFMVHIFSQLPNDNESELGKELEELKRRVSKLELQNYLLQLFIRDIYENTEVVDDDGIGDGDDSNNSPFDSFDSFPEDGIRQ